MVSLLPHHHLARMRTKCPSSLAKDGPCPRWGGRRQPDRLVRPPTLLGVQLQLPPLPLLLEQVLLLTSFGADSYEGVLFGEDADNEQ